MGTSQPKFYDYRLQGTLSTEQCRRLDFIRSVYESDSAIDDLTHLIFDLSPDQVQDVIDRHRPLDEGTSLPKGTLRPYQTVGVAFMYYSQSCMIGDSVGLGKTTQIAGLYNLIKMETCSAPRTLFFSEKVSASDIRRELVRFTGDYWEYSTGTARDVDRFIHSYDGDDLPSGVLTHSAIKSPLFQSWFLSLSRSKSDFPYDLIVIDESSVLGSTTSEIYKTTKSLFLRSPRMIIMNATPFETNLDTFYNQLNLLDPKFLPTKTYFDKEFKIMDYSGVFPRFTGNYRNSEQFSRMVEFRYLPRTRRELGATIENCTAEIIPVFLSSSQKRLLKDTYLHKLVYDCPWELDPEIESCSKIDAACDLVTGRLSNDQVLIYSHHLSAQEVLADHLQSLDVSVEVLNGNTRSSDAKDLISRFRDGSTRVLITNIQKSLNFGHVNHCIFYGYNPNPNKMIQFEGRITRDFHIKDKHVYVILSEGKETDTFYSTIAARAQASESFAGADFSLVLDLLKKKPFVPEGGFTL